MRTLLFSQPDGKEHKTPQGHAECPARLTAVERALSGPSFSKLLRRDAESADLSLAELVHSRQVLKRLRDMRPLEGISKLDEDTFISPGSFNASSQALGAALGALEAVVLGEAENAFCAIRPPGHHAEIDLSMGFCLVNTVAIAAREAQRKHGADRVAIIDFDVHHGNGTQDIFKDDPSVFYASSHQMPLFPGTGAPSETGVGNIWNAALAPNSDGNLMREAYIDRLLPALEAFSPDIMFISAGFDAEKRDPLAQLNWKNSDFAWLTGKLMDIADRHCDGRVISLLEGGYDLNGLAAGVQAHVTMLQGGNVSDLV